MEFKSLKSAIEGGKRQKHNINDNNETRTLPDSIIMDEIIARLPVKSLIRFQSVSKYWFSHISKNPSFAKRHVMFSSLLRPQFIFRSFSSNFCGNYDFFLLPYQECSNERDFVGIHHCDDVDCTEIVGSCNGLVCLYHREDDEWSEDWERERKWIFELWNPATRKYNEIDSPPGGYLGLAYGFGYVPSLDDYKIVASFASERQGEEVLRGFYVFSLRSGEWNEIFSGYDYSSKYRKWRRIKNFSNEDREKEKIVLKLNDEGFWNDGVLYWAPEEYSSRHYIIGFDLASEEFTEYTSVDWKQEYNSVELFRLKECLALHGRKSDKVSDFWMLKDSEDWGSWQKLFSIALDEIPFILISQTSKCLVQQSKQFKLVDLQKEALESTEGDGGFYVNQLKAVDHVESLVSPFDVGKSNEVEEELQSTENSFTNAEIHFSNRPSPTVSCRLMVPSSEKNINIESDVQDGNISDSHKGHNDSEEDIECDSSDDEDNESDYGDNSNADSEAYSDWENDGNDERNSDDYDDYDDDDDDDEEEQEEEEEDDDDE